MAESLEELAEKIPGIDKQRFLSTLYEYNAAASGDVPFDPTRKDGLCTRGLSIPKSNWATPLAKPPFEAYGCTNGITFTFGGVRIDPQCHVLDVDGNIIPGLFAAGEMVGGLFYCNYPGGLGLTSAAVFGRIAGTSAASR